MSDPNQLSHSVSLQLISSVMHLPLSSTEATIINHMVNSGKFPNMGEGWGIINNFRSKFLTAGEGVGVGFKANKIILLPTQFFHFYMWDLPTLSSNPKLLVNVHLSLQNKTFMLAHSQVLFPGLS